MNLEIRTVWISFKRFLKTVLLAATSVTSALEVFFYVLLT